MLTPLSKRLQPEICELKYPETTEQFRNQITVLIVDFIECMCDDELAGYVIYTYYSNTGKGTMDPTRYYSTGALHKMLINLKDEDYIDFIDIFVQFCYQSKELCRKVEFNSLVEDINDVMRMNGIDLQIEDGKCKRISEPTIQQEIINPAFRELYRLGFVTAHEYLSKSFELFKQRDNQSAIVSANSALEATIDYIMKENKLISEKDKIPNKITILVKNDVLPPEYETIINSLTNILQTSSIIRNRNGGHGTSSDKKVDDLFVQYAIDSAASAILFLARLYEYRRRNSK